MNILKEIFLFTGRKLRGTRRNFGHMFMVLLTPLLYLVLFAPLLKNVGLPVSLGSGNVLNIFVPGMLTLLSFNGGIWVGFNIIDELRSGVIERFKVAPIGRVSMLLGALLHDILVNVIGIIFFVVVAIPFGFKLHMGGFLLTIPLLSLLVVTSAACSYGLGLMTKSEDHLAPIVHGIHMPLMLLSGMMLPMDLAPAWLRTIALCNPMYHVVQACRSLVNEDFGSSSIVIAYGLMLPLAVVVVLWCKRVFVRAVF